MAEWCDGRGLCLKTLNSEEYWTFYRSMRERLADTTVRTRLLGARNYYGYLKGQGVRADNPTAEIVAGRMPKRTRIPYTPDELARLLLAARDTQPPLRDVTLFTLLSASGGRRCEVVLGLHTDQIDWERGRLNIMGKGGKPRALQPGPTAMAVLRAYVGERRGPVWLTKDGRPLSRAGAWDVVQRAALKAGVRGATLHRFRRTFASSFLKQSGDFLALKTILGHSDWGMVELYVSYEAAESALELQAKLDLGA